MTSPITVTHDHAGIATIALHGEHEAFTTPRLAAELEDALDAGYGITVDLRETAFIDSTIASALLAARRHADELHADFVVVLGDGTGWPVRRLIQITGLDSMLPIVG